MFFVFLKGLLNISYQGMRDIQDGKPSNFFLYYTKAKIFKKLFTIAVSFQYVPVILHSLGWMISCDAKKNNLDDKKRGSPKTVTFFSEVEHEH